MTTPWTVPRLVTVASLKYCDKSHSSSIDRLPAECLVEIFNYLPSNVLAVLAELYHPWKRIIYENCFRKSNVTVGPENFYQLPVVRRAKLPENRTDPRLSIYPLLRFSPALTHLEVNAPLPDCSRKAAALRHLKDVGLSSLSLGPECNFYEWNDFFKENRRLESLRIISSGYTPDLPATLKKIVTDLLFTQRLEPCRESLRHIETLGRLCVYDTVAFPNLKTVVAESCEGRPLVAPNLERLEVTRSFHYDVKALLSSCRLALVVLRLPFWNGVLPSSFPRLESLTIRNLSVENDDFPSLKALEIKSLSLIAAFPTKSLQVRRLSVAACDFELNPQQRLNALLDYVKKLTLLTSLTLKAFASTRIESILNAVSAESLTELCLKVGEGCSWDLSKFLRLKILKLSVFYDGRAAVKLPVSKLEKLSVRGDVRFETDRVTTERLVLNDVGCIDVLRKCLNGGLRTLTVKETVVGWPEEFLQAISKSGNLFALYVCVCGCTSEVFQSRVQSSCPFLRVCEVTRKICWET